jgi:hypothetical protein
MLNKRVSSLAFHAVAILIGMRHNGVSHILFICLVIRARRCLYLSLQAYGIWKDAVVA